MTRRVVGAFVIIASLSVLAACSLLVSTSGLDDGASPDGGGNNGGADAIGPRDGAAAGDGTSPFDGPSTDAANTDSSTTSFRCANAIGGHRLCADFEGTDLKDGWTEIITLALNPNNSGLSIIPDPASSTTSHVLQAKLRDSHSSQQSARLGFVMAPLPKTVHIELDIQPSGPVTGGYYELVKLELPNPTDTEADGFLSSAITLFSDDSAQYFIDSFPPSLDGGATPNETDFPIPAPPTDHLSHFIFDIAFNGVTMHLKLVADYTTKPLVDADMPSPGMIATGMTVVVGSYSDDAPAVTTLIDNVVVDTTN